MGLPVLAFLHCGCITHGLRRPFTGGYLRSIDEHLGLVIGTCLARRIRLTGFVIFPVFRLMFSIFGDTPRYFEGYLASPVLESGLEFKVDGLWRRKHQGLVPFLDTQAPFLQAFGKGINDPRRVGTDETGVEAEFLLLQETFVFALKAFN